MDENTVDSIMNTLERWAAEKRPIDATTMLDACLKLTLLLGDEANDLYTLEKQIAEEKVKWLNQGKTVAYANLQVAASQYQFEAKLKAATIKRVEELVRISKIRARLADNEYRSQ